MLGLVLKIVEPTKFNVPFGKYEHPNICDEELIIKSGKTGTGINDKIWIGKAVVDASNLSGIANRNGIKPIAMSSVFYCNVIDLLVKENVNYNKWIEYNYTNNCYHCNIIDTKFNSWIDNGMKG